MGKKCQYQNCTRGCYGEFCLMHKPRKAIKQKGKHTAEYELWRDNTAIPYLERKGHKCVECGATGKLDVDHIKNRGSHYALRMSLTNVQYLCRGCHIEKTRQINAKD